VIPLYGFLAGDTLGLLVLAQPEDTIAILGRKLQSAALVRVAPLARPAVMHRGRRLADGITVAEADLEPLDRFDVVEEETPC
jgi:hypothetical protein